MKKIALEEAMMPDDYFKIIPEEMFNKEMYLLKAYELDLIEKRLEIMDEVGLETTILSVSSPGIQCIKDEKQAIKLAKKWNDYLYQGIKDHPTRLRGFACLAMSDVDEACKEAKRCIEELGFVGIMINDFTSTTNGKNIYYDDPKYLKFWKTIENLNVPVYMHPRGYHITNSNSDFYLKYPEMTGSAWGFHVQIAEHLLRLILSGLFDKCPKLQIIAGHMGEMLPFWVRRMDHRLNYAAKSWHYDVDVERSPRAYTVEHYLKNNFYITTSGFFDTPALMHNIEIMGINRICFSIDYPYENSRFAVDWLEKLDLSPEKINKIAYENAKRLLRI